MSNHDEKDEERAERIARIKSRNIMGTMATAVVPTASFLAIGAEWAAMSAAMQTMSIFATGFMSIATLVSVGIKLDWFDD